MKEATDRFIAKLLSPRPMYDNMGAGLHNSSVLNKAVVRPAFFDSSCLLYRLVYSKAKDYCKRAGDDDTLLAHLLCVDFLRDVAEACMRFSCAPVLAFDSKVSYRKDKLFPGYKEGRKDKQKKDEFEERALGQIHNAIGLLKRDYCPMYNIQQFCVYGYESDDIIASFVLGLKQLGTNLNPTFEKTVVVVTSDHDLHQLLLDGVYLADVNTGVLASGTQVFKHTGIRPEHLVASKCIGGCKSDKIPNIKWCGDVSVKQVLEGGNSDCVTLAKARASLQADDALDILRRNLALIQLPLEIKPAMPPLKLTYGIWPNMSVPDKAATLFNAFGIERDLWPVFHDITRPRPEGATPMCVRTKKKEG